MSLDLAVLEAIGRHRTGWTDAAARGLMDAGQPAGTYVLAAVTALAFAWACRAWRAVAAAMVSSVVATLLAEWLKEVIGRPRPPAALAIVPADGPAFPSSIGALTAGAAVPLVLWGLRRADRTGRAVAALLVAGTLAVGVSMVYLGAHWVSDVLAGWVLGGVVGVVAHRVSRWTPGRRTATAR
ncbi:phosphatase PAP2 family protein [Modestobacter sp. SSW1-42]|uniref:phosphatase PAP2 family protein n=1 Tax=Modestobacter sp. SSW1-42 TaxID=596372 RepID=UPI003987EE65